MSLVRYLLACMAIVTTATLATASHAAVWPVTAQWDEAAEQRYAQWVEANFGENFFFEGTPFEGIATDCADAAYGMRLAFAYENGLPFAVRDPENPGVLVSQATTRFDHVKTGIARVRAYMDWVMAGTSTATLVHDTYPVRIDREQIRPGIIYLTWRTHAMQVVSLSRTGVIRYLESTAPRAIRPMRAILGFPHQVPADPRARQNGDGFRRFRTPQDQGRPERSLPGYGVEQFEQARALNRETLPYYEWMRARLALEPEPLDQLARRSTMALCAMTYDRANAVEEAQELLGRMRRQHRACMNAAEADEHSTPTRDALLLRAFEHLRSIVERPDWLAVSGRYRVFVDLITGWLDERHPDYGYARERFRSWCDVGKLDGGPGRPMDLIEVYRLLRERRMSSDPHGTLAQRWGLDEAEPATAARSAAPGSSRCAHPAARGAAPG